MNFTEVLLTFKLMKKLSVLFNMIQMYINTINTISS